MRRTPMVLLCGAAFVLASCSPSGDPASDRGPSSSTASAEVPGGPDPGASSAPRPTPTPIPTRTLTASLEEVETSVELPREIVDLGGDGERLLVSDQHGTVVVLEAGVERAEPFLVLDGVMAPSASYQELGLVGLALAPDFADSGTVYTYATFAPADDDPTLTARVDVVSKWTADPETLVVDPESEEVLLREPSEEVTHAGELAVDDAGLLYISRGSTRSDGAAQDPQDLAGKILRIDPTSPSDGRPYSVPEDNPDPGPDGRPEVFSSGYRNPWRLSWDPDLGLVAGEAMAREKAQQVHLPTAGSQAGYPDIRAACWVQRSLADTCRATLAGDQVTPPVLEYPGAVGTILSAALPLGQPFGELAGSVLVADWNGTLLLAEPGDEPWSFTELDLELDPTGGDRYLWTLGAGGDGVVYVSTVGDAMADGSLWRLTLSG